MRAASVGHLEKRIEPAGFSCVLWVVVPTPISAATGDTRLWRRPNNSFSQRRSASALIARRGVLPLACCVENESTTRDSRELSLRRQREEQRVCCTGACNCRRLRRLKSWAVEHESYRLVQLYTLVYTTTAEHVLVATHVCYITTEALGLPAKNAEAAVQLIVQLLFPRASVEEELHHVC